LFCSNCGTLSAPNGNYCAKCGSSLSPPPALQGSSIGIKSRTRTWVAVAIALILFVILSARPNRDSSSEKLAVASEQTSRQVEPVLNVPSIALQRRADVEALIGKPAAYQKRTDESVFGDEADYPWGLVAYNSGRVVFIIVKFPAKPPDFKVAFEMLSLPEPPAPYRRNDETLIWNESTFGNGVSCCGGLTFRDVFINGAMSEIHLELLDADNPTGWSRSERQMWNKWTRQSSGRVGK